MYRICIVLNDRQWDLTLTLQKSRIPQVPPLTGSSFNCERHQGRSCSRLPQGFDNARDAVSSAFLKGKQHSKKGIFIGFKQRFDLMKVTAINAKPFSMPFDI
ncbi:MAG: hypothetical protein C0611_07920 [Desulfobacteraceae bacterium]|nr:MAG: hypothetical protein C0611_07920 [Desulfobacteraceae bacterium]